MSNSLSRNSWPEDDDEKPFGLKPHLEALREKRVDDHITVSVQQLIDLVLEADTALDGDSNDDEHDALYSIRESIADLINE